MRPLTDLLECLVSDGVLDLAVAGRVAVDGAPVTGEGRWFEMYDVLSEQGVPALWWTESIIESDWCFTFWLDSIAATQIDDELIDVIQPAMAELGVDLSHDWNIGEQPSNCESDGITIWLNGEPCTFRLPTSVGCVQPLVMANRFLREADSERQFYFCGKQWEPSCSDFIDESVTVALLPARSAEMLVDSEHVISAAKPYLVDDILT